MIARDITRQKREEEDRLRLIEELTDALRQVKTLTGLLPVCSSCKRIREEDGSWLETETYIARKSKATVTQSLCPQCSAIFSDEADKLADT